MEKLIAAVENVLELQDGQHSIRDRDDAYAELEASLADAKKPKRAPAKKPAAKPAPKTAAKRTAKKTPAKKPAKA